MTIYGVFRIAPALCDHIWCVELHWYCVTIYGVLNSTGIVRPYNYGVLNSTGTVRPYMVC